ncbi:hypothetical protein CsSME_00053333 [Camellia sinensis var. sinensis]
MVSALGPKKGVLGVVLFGINKGLLVLLPVLFQHWGCLLCFNRGAWVKGQNRVEGGRFWTGIEDVQFWLDLRSGALLQVGVGGMSSGSDLWSCFGALFGGCFVVSRQLFDVLGGSGDGSGPCPAVVMVVCCVRLWQCSVPITPTAVVVEMAVGLVRDFDLSGCVLSREVPMQCCWAWVLALVNKIFGRCGHWLCGECWYSGTELLAMELSGRCGSAAQVNILRGACSTGGKHRCGRVAQLSPS